jgi:hypothetical protein
MITNISGQDVTGLIEPWTPTYGFSSGSATITTNSSRAIRFGQQMFFYVGFTVTAAGTAGGAALYVYLPVACVPFSSIHGIQQGGSYKTILGLLLANSTLISVMGHDNVSIITTGNGYTLQGWVNTLAL